MLEICDINAVEFVDFLLFAVEAEFVVLVQ